MLEKVKGKISDIKEEAKRKRDERIRIAKERAEEEARIERERIQAEKEALMKLSEKELLVEAIIALRGYNARIGDIERQQEELEDRVYSLELQVDYFGSSDSDD